MGDIDKWIGLGLALGNLVLFTFQVHEELTVTSASSVFIGASFIFVKIGLINTSDERATDGGHGYLKNAIWWAGMVLSTYRDLHYCVVFVETRHVHQNC
jgi:hypothetical protein